MDMSLTICTQKSARTYIHLFAHRNLTYCHALHTAHTPRIYARCVYLCCLCMYVASIIRVSDLHHSFNYERQIRTEPRADSVIELLRR